ncbi:MAG: class I adenylate-forming enzyme family protein, partial [Pseudomonadota bacterium]
MNTAGIVDLVPSGLRQQWKEDGTYPNISVYEAFCLHARRNPDKIAAYSGDESISFRVLHEKCRRLATSFKQLGIVPGDTIAYQLQNHWRCCAIDLAAAALGAVIAPFPPGRGRLDLESLLKRSCARVIIIEPEFKQVDFCSIVESIRPSSIGLRHLVVNSHKPRKGWLSLASLFESDLIQQDQLPDVPPDSPVRMLVSSGTESEPKLVAYSHNAMLGGRGRFLQRLCGHKGDEFRGMYLVPLGSSFGSTATIGILCWLGGSLVLQPAFDAEAAIEAIERHRPTHILGVPTMLQRMMTSPRLSKIDRSSLVALISGGALIDKATIERCLDKFGCHFISLYGSADGVNCHNMMGDGLDLIAYSVGRPNPEICEIEIVDEQRRPVPQGVVGEIRARGPISPLQYVNDNHLNELYRDRGGWAYTGDLGCIDNQGYLVLAGRKKDIIIRGGTNISPVQIENQATSHPDIISAACVPVPDDDLGARVCICLTLRPESKRLSLRALTHFLTERGLEVNKLPEYLAYYRQMPLSPAGKVDKKKLASEIVILGCRKSDIGQYGHPPCSWQVRTFHSLFTKQQK